ncbi:MHO_1580 family protein [[Mycoplasma] anseris]|uniref:Uncharacterized protein n=1 Tax=[Mycoplasma] anseris TaxID=92400 RepID=A0A2Z4NCK0_9BACT|nr:hypothetical protein [[Mycoplasma] anseris]AWX69237.1 hypothetical protein DP065_00480 [[Mycoplasma] anseris]
MLLNNQLIKNIENEKLAYRVEKRIYNQDLLNASEKFKLNFERIINIDGFILNFNYQNDTLKYLNNQLFVTITINNKVILQNVNLISNNGTFEIKFISETAKTKIKFSEIKNINIELVLQNDNNIKQIYGLSIYLDRQNINKEFVIDSNGIGIGIIKKINIIFSNDENLNDLLIKHSNIEYLYYVFKPKVLKIGNQIETLYELDILNNKNNIPNQSDYSALNIKNITICNDKTNKPEFIFDYTSPTKKILINSYSFYDVENKKMIFNTNNPNAKRGICISPNFVGNFSHDMEFSIGENLNDYKLHYNQVVNQPYLHAKRGLIKMKIKQEENYFEQAKWKTIYYRNLNKVIEEAKTLLDIENKGGE